MSKYRIAAKYVNMVDRVKPGDTLTHQQATLLRPHELRQPVAIVRKAV